MNIIIGTVLLWAAAIWLIRRLRTQDEAMLGDAVARAKDTFVFILPRVALGIVGAGFLAEMMPRESIETLFGEGAGYGAVPLAVVLGALTPGGPFVAFAVGAAALKAGAGEGAVLAYVTAWMAVCINQSLAYEAGFMGWGFLLRRWTLSIPVPLVLGTVLYLV